MTTTQVQNQKVTKEGFRTVVQELLERSKDAAHFLRMLQTMFKINLKKCLLRYESGHQVFVIFSGYGLGFRGRVFAEAHMD